jgi:peptidoglycan hydrolase-like protein with peptidoglycan-binding domain
MAKWLIFLLCALSLCASTTAFAITRPIIFPVGGPASFQDDFADPRAGGTRSHLGVDIIATKMTPALAAVDGVVSYVVSPEASWGYSISIRDAEGYQYRYLHLNNDTPGTDDGLGGEAHAYAPGIVRGAHVVKGQLVGWVGDSGNAEATVAHLHFEIRDPSRGAISPYDSLVAAAAVRPDVVVKDLGKPAGGVNPATEPTPTAISAGVFTRTLTLKSTGEEVRQLQMRLQALGYFDEAVTGFFGPITRDAVVAFQRAEGLEPVGSVGPKTRAVLNGVSVQYAKADGIYVFLFTKTLARKSEGEEVRQLQIHLKSLGFYAYPEITGYFGAVTEAAVKAFQKAHALEVVGIVGPRTRLLLNNN